MKGMILAAGVGSRLSPLTAAVPKPMVPVADKPVMEYALEMLVRAGITDVKANLHHLPHVVEAHFRDGGRWGARLSYSLERTLLGTAGAVRRVRRFFDDTLVVTVADSVWDVDLGAAIEFHKSRGAMATVVVKPFPIAEIGRFGVVRAADDGRILQFQEKPRPEEACSDLASTGLYILEPEALDLIPPGEFFDFARDLFRVLLERDLPFYAYRYEGPWSDIGTFGEYAQVHWNVLNGDYSRLLLPARERAPGVYQGHHVTIHPEALVRPPVLLGNHCRILRRAVVGPNAVVGEHGIVGEDASVVESIVGAHTYVGRMVDLNQCLAHGRWLVRLPAGPGLYVDDDLLLADGRAPRAARGLTRAVDLGLAGTGLAAAAPLFLGLGVLARLGGQRTVESAPHLAPDLRRTAPTGVPQLRPFPLLRFSAEGLVGKVARRLGVSRLPGLYNVVRGDISLVGTRPLSEEEAAHVPEEWRSHLYQAPAGFTGLWHLQGEDEATREEMLAADAYYAATRTFWGDLRILWQAGTHRARR